MQHSKIHGYNGIRPKIAFVVTEYYIALKLIEREISF